MIKQEGIYQHFKGNYYKVIGFATHTESEEGLVLYKKVFKFNSIWMVDDLIWARPYDRFCDKVTREGETFQRFTLCEELPK